MNSVCECQVSDKGSKRSDDSYISLPAVGRIHRTSQGSYESLVSKPGLCSSSLSVSQEGMSAMQRSWILNSSATTRKHRTNKGRSATHSLERIDEKCRLVHIVGEWVDVVVTFGRWRSVFHFWESHARRGFIREAATEFKVDKEDLESTRFWGSENQIGSDQVLRETH